MQTTLTKENYSSVMEELSNAYISIRYDTASKTLQFYESLDYYGPIVTLDKSTLQQFIKELQEIESKM